MKILGIHFAPVFIPLQRRIQTLAAFGWITLILTGAPLAWMFFLWSVFYSPLLRFPCLAYALWMYFDRDAIESGHRRSPWVRNWKWWQKFQEYFPVKIVKTSDLSPDRSYLFVTFPHGILSVGPFCAFSTDSCHFDKVFPGLIPTTVTLNMHFVTPFIRELGLALGSIPAHESLLVKKLSQKGNALCLVVGGAAEAFHSKPNEYNILLDQRKGFIRVAFRSGASIVPTISFGEPNVYDQIERKPGTFLRWTQESYKKLTGIAPVYLKGRGIFQYTYGLLPFRTPVTLVTGNPIHVPKTENPTKEQIENLHAEFKKQLTILFNNEKHKYVSESMHLNFIQN